MKLQIYCCSLLAIRTTVSEEDFIPESVSMHTPALIPAESIAAAGEKCRLAAHRNWPIDDKWHSHQAMIQPVTKHFFELAVDALNSDGIDQETVEEGVCFNLEAAP